MSKRIAYGGILLALNIILLMLVNIIPTNTISIMALSSFLLAIVVVEFGFKMGVVYYVAVACLSFIILSNKFHWILYVLTFGVYGIAKYVLEITKNIYMEYFLKIAYANIAMVIVVILMKQFMYIPVNIYTIVGFEIMFLIYDRVYSNFIIYYYDKLRSKLRI